MSLQSLMDGLPDYAADAKDNLAALMRETLLTDQQKWGCFLACAFASGVPPLVKAFEAETRTRLTPEAASAAKAAVAIMAMNTVYFGATHILQNHDYRALPPNLRMTRLLHPNIDKIDFELWAFAVSAMTSCAACLSTHEAELHKRGVTLERVQAALRIAATVNAAGVVIRAEAALAA